MGTTSRRGFLKGLGATLSAIGVSADLSPVFDPDLDPDGATASVATPAAPAASYGYFRKPLAPEALELLAAEQLAAWVAERRSFTAYDVTLALRAAHPAYNIAHQHVRQIVHERMWPALRAYLYDQELVAFPTGSACRYRPLA